MKQPNFALTVDVEEWFQVENLRGAFPADQWDKAPSRLAESMSLLLTILADGQVNSATFFVLGWIAKRHPEIVKTLAAAGYEIASHGMDHRLNSELDGEGIERDLRDSKNLLEEITGRSVIGYRAPSFSVSDGVIAALRSCGYRYDSSFNDVAWHDRYGRLDLSGYSKSASGTYLHPDRDLLEIPISNLSILGRTIPWGGGGWFRLIPSPVHRAGVRRMCRDKGLFVFYMHPWEIDDKQPRMNQLTRLSAFRHYNNLDKTAIRLRALIRDVRSIGARFVALKDLLTTE